MPVSDALPDDIEEISTDIIAEGQAAIQQGGIWVGSLLAFYRDEGYWLKKSIDEDDNHLDFQWVIPEV